jgi:mono/diheme cytochrome c family protein
VFDRFCAECHQSGRLKASQAGGGLRTILDLEDLAKTEAYVRSGKPDGSPLLMLMQMRMAPHDADTAGRDLELTALDLAAVRDWIQGLPPPAGCAARSPVSHDEIGAAVLAHLEAAGPRAVHLRYLSLAHLHNACATAAALKAARDAVTLAVNALSWAPKPIRPPAIGPSDTILVIDLEAFGWSSDPWERLARQNPYGAAALGNPVLEGLAASAQPILRADWFVAATLGGPTYADWLGLPDQLPDLFTRLKIGTGPDGTKRWGVRTSTVTRGARLIQRHPMADRAAWSTTEYAATPGRSDPFEGAAAAAARPAPRGDAQLALFQLPNAFSAFFIANGEGARIPDLPASILRNEVHPRRLITPGAACLGCHTQGPRGATDELRARVQADGAVAKDIRDRALSILPTSEEAQRLVTLDQARTREAMAGVGLDGTTSLTDTLHRYRRAVTLEELAAELGLSPMTLRLRASQASEGPLADTLQRLLHGPVPRRVVEAQFSALATTVRAEASATPPEPPPAVDEGFTLVLRTGPDRYRVGDLFTVTARVTQPCFLTLINIDRNGRGTVIFPNDFEPNNQVQPGRELRVPPPQAAYQFRLADPGRETVVGVCQAASRIPPGIRHDFERQRFTELGDYRAFLARTFAGPAPERTSQQKAVEAQKQRANRRAGQPDGPAPPLPKGEAQARAAVTIDILP